MRNVMVDLETLALDSNALILSIGAVEFDPQHGIGAEYYGIVSADLQEKKWKRVVDPGTVKWWSEQSPEARRVLDEAAQAAAPKLDAALNDFSRWYASGGGGAIWGYGAHFDNVVLANAFDAVHLACPWSYKDNRCFRTLKALVSDLSLLVPMQGEAHNALDDARYQARYAVRALNRLQEVKK